jgi:DNA topoisomerase-1
MLKLGRKADGQKYAAEDLADIELETVKKMIEEQVPNAFSKKTPAKKAAKKKTAVKKTVKKAAKKK